MSQRHQPDNAVTGEDDDLFLAGLLTVAAFLLGVFAAIILLGPQ